MLQIKLTTGDPVKGWETGLAWVFIQSFMLMIGGFIAPVIRAITPRAAWCRCRSHVTHAGADTHA